MANNKVGSHAFIFFYIFLSFFGMLIPNCFVSFLLTLRKYFIYFSYLFFFQKLFLEENWSKLSSSSILEKRNPDFRTWEILEGSFVWGRVCKDASVEAEKQVRQEVTVAWLNVLTENSEFYSVSFSLVILLSLGLNINSLGLQKSSGWCYIPGCFDPSGS